MGWIYWCLLVEVEGEAMVRIRPWCQTQARRAGPDLDDAWPSRVFPFTRCHGFVAGEISYPGKLNVQNRPYGGVVYALALFNLLSPNVTVRPGYNVSLVMN